MPGVPIPTATTAQIPSTSAPTPNMTATGQAAASTATQQAQRTQPLRQWLLARPPCRHRPRPHSRHRAQVQPQPRHRPSPRKPWQPLRNHITAAQAATSGQASYSDPLNNPASTGTTAANGIKGDNCTFQSDGYHVTTSPLVTPLNELSRGQQILSKLCPDRQLAIKKGTTGGVFFRMQANSLAFGACTWLPL